MAQLDPLQRECGASPDFGLSKTGICKTDVDGEIRAIIIGNHGFGEIYFEKGSLEDLASPSESHFVKEQRGPLNEHFRPPRSLIGILEEHIRCPAAHGVNHVFCGHISRISIANGHWPSDRW